MKEKKKYPPEIIKAADSYIGFPPELGESVETYMRREAFKEGAAWMAHKLVNLDIPEYPEKIIKKEIEFVDKCLAEGIRPTFAGTIQYALNVYDTK